MIQIYLYIYIYWNHMPWHPHFCWVFLKLAKKILGVFNRKKKQQNAPKTHKHPGQIRQRDGRNWYWEVRLFLLGKRWDLIVSKCPGFTRVPFFKRTYLHGKNRYTIYGGRYIYCAPQPQIHSWICWLKWFTHRYIYIYTWILQGCEIWAPWRVSV